MNNNNIIFSKKKINLILPILLVSALILGPLVKGNDVFATLDCCSFKQTSPNAANTGGGSNKQTKVQPQQHHHHQRQGLCKSL